MRRRRDQAKMGSRASPATNNKRLMRWRIAHTLSATPGRDEASLPAGGGDALSLIWMAELYRKGLSTQDALFTIASEMVEVEAAEELQSLTGSELLKKAAGHNIQVKVKRNGEITYKMPFKK